MANPRIRIVIVVLVAVLLVPGCGTIRGWFGKGKASAEAGEPAALVKFEQSVQPRRNWSRSIGKGEGRLWLRQAPTVAEGRVYTADSSGRVSSLSPDKGAVIWTNKTKLRYSTSPGVGAGVVVLATLEGEVVALNADTGAERWQSKVLSEVVATPVITQGLAIVRASDGRVYGLDLADGRRRWVYDRSLPSLTVRGSGTPALGQDVVYVGYGDGSVVALRIIDGLRVWEQTVAEPEGRSELERMADIDGEIKVGLDRLYAVSYKGRIAALNNTGGAPVWTRELKAATGVALARDRVIVADVEGNVWALDRNSGNALWRQDALAFRWLTTPVIQGDYVLVGDVEGYLHWLRLDTGELAGRARLGGDPIRATPQISPEGVAYVVNTDGKLAAYRLGGG